MTTLHHDTPGLDAAQAAQRRQAVRRWLLRIYELCAASGCSVRVAVRAIEATDQEHTHTAD
jgi:hypothetical protein